MDKGLGDTIARLIKAGKFDKVIKLVREDCGCEERQEYLNKKFPYKNEG